MLHKFLDKDLRFRAIRKGTKLLRARLMGLDVVWEKFRWAQIIRKVDSHEVFLEYGAYSFAGKVNDRSECIHELTDEGERGQLLQLADDALDHVFDLLGSGKTELGPELDWHKDFISGYRWDKHIHYSRCLWGHLPKGVDIKVPWELSRCMHLSTLALADWLTGDARYYEGFKSDIRSWILHNPFERGVNWSCPMDVALRAVNWLNAVQLFAHRISEDEEQKFFKNLSQSLWFHGRHLERNLEWMGPVSRSAGNHFLANLLGLLAVGLVFRKHRQGRRWMNFAKEHLEDQMLRQVYQDGTNFETSTSYHRLAQEMFLWADSLVLRAGESFSEEYCTRLAKMASFVQAYSSPSGESPQFGDNDSGRVLATGMDDGSDHRYLTKGDVGVGGKLHRFLLRGALQMPAPPEYVSGEFPDGGYWFLRKQRAFLGVRAGRQSFTGGHAHCDQLSFVLNVDATPVIVDRGTGCYTSNPKIRNLLRNTYSHNTPQINNWEQNRFDLDSKKVFGMRDDTRTEVEEFDPEGVVIARHFGFETHRPGLICKRSFKLNDERLSIEDYLLNSRDGDTIQWRFHLAPGCKAKLAGGTIDIHSPAGIVKLMWPSGIDVIISSCKHSSSYGRIEQADVIEFTTPRSGKNDNPYRFEFTW